MPATLLRCALRALERGPFDEQHDLAALKTVFGAKSCGVKALEGVVVGEPGVVPHERIPRPPAQPLGYTQPSALHILDSTRTTRTCLAYLLVSA